MSPKKILRASEPPCVPGNRADGLGGLIFHRKLPRGNPGRSGFTFVEILVALCIGAMVVAAVAMANGSIVVHGPRRTRSENVSISPAVFQNFYGVSQDTVAVSQAPDYGGAAMAESMREKFNSDVSSAIAVFCLGRNGLSGFHLLHRSDVGDKLLDLCFGPLHERLGRERPCDLRNGSADNLFPIGSVCQREKV